MISPVIIDTDHSFKRQNALCLTKKLFIKVSIFYGAPLTFSYFLLQGNVLCSTRVGKTCEIIPYYEDFVKKIISPVILDTNRSFER